MTRDYMIKNRAYQNYSLSSLSEDPDFDSLSNAEKHSYYQSAESELESEDAFECLNEDEDENDDDDYQDEYED